MTAETELLLRFLDGELSGAEAERFRARLARSPELSRRLREMRRVGALLRFWAEDAQSRAGELLEPTLQRVRRASLPQAAGSVSVKQVPWPSALVT